MRSRSTILSIVLFFVWLACSTSCDLINPEEKIPSFICIDSISFDAGGHGNTYNKIVDAWVYDNEQLVGVYEMPAVVPILNSGDVNIRIRPGVILNGQAASRYRLNFLEDFEGSVELFEDSVVCVNPALSYKDWVSFPWLEDFDDSNVMTLMASNINEAGLTITSGSEALDDQSVLLRLPDGKNVMEYKRSSDIPLPSGGADVILEFSYKCNHTFLVGLISITPAGTIQTGVMAVSPSEEWNHLYVNLTEVASTYFTATGHIPFFGLVREEGFEGDIEVYLDNIRILH